MGFLFWDALYKDNVMLISEEVQTETGSMLHG